MKQRELQPDEPVSARGKHFSSPEKCSRKGMSFAAGVWLQTSGTQRFCDESDVMKTTQFDDVKEEA